MGRNGLTGADLAPNAVRHWAAETPETVFLEHVDGRRITYREVDAELDRWASALHGVGLAPGSRVATFVTDPITSAIVWLAIGRAGMVSVPLNTAHIGAMLLHVLTASDAQALIVSPDLAGRLADVPDGVRGLELVVVLDGDGDRVELGRPTMTEADLLGAAGPPGTELPEPEPHDIAMLLFTSGTTGPSKAVVVPWAGAHGYWSWVPEDTLAAGEALYIPMTMFHITGLGSLQFAAWRGGRFVTRDRFSGTAFWDDVRATGAVAAGLVGPMTAVLAAAPPRPDDADNPLRSLILGPVIPGTEDLERRFGVRVATCYGMTEVPPVIATGWDHGPWETCGRLVEGYPWPEARVVDEHDHELAPGEVGELIVRTGAPWTLNLGYHGNPDATVAAWRNGWFHTGDAFRRDDDGWFYFVDRTTDTIRRRGENISSFEVESAVVQHPAVDVCAAFAVPDAYGGHDVMVTVVPPAGAAVDPAELGQWLVERLPKFMVPRYIDVAGELPRNTTSLRVQKFVLRQRGVTPSTWDREA